MHVQKFTVWIEKTAWTFAGEYIFWFLLKPAYTRDKNEGDHRGGGWGKTSVITACPEGREGEDLCGLSWRIKAMIGKKKKVWPMTRAMVIEVLRSINVYHFLANNLFSERRSRLLIQNNGRHECYYSCFAVLYNIVLECYNTMNMPWVSSSGCTFSLRTYSKSVWGTLRYYLYLRVFPLP